MDLLTHACMLYKMRSGPPQRKHFGYALRNRRPLVMHGSLSPQAYLTTPTLNLAAPVSKLSHKLRPICEEDKETMKLAMHVDEAVDHAPRAD